MGRDFLNSSKWLLLDAAAEGTALGRAARWELLARREARLFAGPLTTRRLTAAALMAPAIALIGFMLQLVAEGPAIADRYQEFDRQAQAIEIADARGRWLGIIPAAMEPSLVSGIPKWPEHRSVAIETVPRAWLDVLVALEDRHVGTWRSWSGIDLFAIARAAVLGSIGDSGRGASTLVMQLVRSMRHLAPGGDVSFTARLKRKWLEVRHGAMLYRAYGGIGDRRLQRLLARHLPLVQGAPDSRMGSVLHGLGLSARVLFGKSAENLDLAEQAVLAAAVRRHVLLAPPGDSDGTALRDDRWQELTARASLGLRLAYGERDPRVSAAIDRLRAMPVPVARDDLAEVSGRESSERFRITANPELRAAALLKGELVTALGELWSRFGAEYRGRMAGITLTIDAVENAAFKRRVEIALADLETRLGDRLSLPLLARGGADGVAQVVLIEADGAGKIRRHYLNSNEPLGLGLIWQRQGDGPMALVPSDRHVGSVAKAALAVLLGTTDAPTARYCNQSTVDGGIHNFGSDSGVADCGVARAWHTISDVFGRSLNLPLLWRLRRVPTANLVELAGRSGLHLDADAPAATAMVLGLASAAPVQLLAMMQAVGAGVDGRPAVATLPRIVESCRLLDEDGTISSETASGKNVVDLREYFKASGTAGFVQQALLAPLKPGGTLAALAAGWR